MDFGLYHFRDHPFPDTSTPASLFLSASHRAALQALQAGITAQRGFVVLLGADGLGKTTLLHAALARLDLQQYWTLPLRATALSLQAILVRLGQAYGCSADTEHLHVMTDRLRQVFLQEEQQGRHVVLVIDDAHTLDVQTLWNLRLLSDLMQTPTGHLIQIVLVGRPELNGKLHRPELQQLRQRFTMRTLLTPLTPPESLAYIHHRLAQVGTDNAVVFAPRVLARLVKDGHGNPRRLNSLCSTALTLSAVDQQRPMSTKMVREVLTTLASSPAAVRRLQKGMVYATGCLLSLGLLWLGPYDLVERFQRLFILGRPQSQKTLAIAERRPSPGSNRPVEPFQTTTVALGVGGEPRASASGPLAEPLLPTSVDLRKLISASPSLPLAEHPVLTLATGNAYAPFTGTGLPEQGMLSDIVQTVFTALGYTIVLEFRDWQAGLQATGNGLFTGMFPYSNTQEHLTQFLYSKPLYRSFIRAFVRTEYPITLETPEDLQRVSVCWSENPFPQKGVSFFALPDAVRPPPQTLDTCLARLIRAQVDVVVANELHAYAVLHSMGVTNKIRALPKALESHTLHLLLPKYAPQSHTLVYEFDQSLALLEKAGVLNAIITHHLQHYPDFPAAPATFPPLTQAGRRP